MSSAPSAVAAYSTYSTESTKAYFQCEHNDPSLPTQIAELDYPKHLKSVSKSFTSGLVKDQASE